MAITSPQGFATAVLQGLGAPTTANNVQTIVDWMAAENPWPPPRNNPLNNGLGSGGGSGLGSYPSLDVAAQYVVQNLNSGNYGYPAVVSALMSNAPETTFKQAIINSDWAGGHYQGTDYGNGYTVNGTPPAGGGATAAPAAPQTVGSASNSGGSPSAPESTTIDGITYVTPPSDVANTSQAGLASQTSALAQLNATLVGYGFSTGDANTLTQWAWGEITNNVDPTQVALAIQTPGSAAYPVFEKYFPGFVSANTELQQQGLAAVSVQQYQQYQTQAQAMAQAAGLPAGFINSQDIGTLVGRNVSTAELARLNQATALAINSTPEQQAMFNQYFGAAYASGTLLPLGPMPPAAPED